MNAWDAPPAPTPILRPTPKTDAYEDSVSRDVPIVFLAGPIKHWWSCWGSTSHRAYVRHREAVRDALIAAGYMTYAPWDAIKGTWCSRAQAINNAGIAAADVMLDLTPSGVPAHGTTAECQYARSIKTPVLMAPPRVPVASVVRSIERLVGPGHPYEEAA